jgi:predicted metal-dependent hydrolase
VPLSSKAHHVTIFLDRHNSVLEEAMSKFEKKAAYACRYGPRLREALFRKLKATPIKSDQRGKLNLIGIAEQIKPAMAKALNKNTIQLVQVVQGDRKISSTQISMLNRNGCVRIFQKN